MITLKLKRILYTVESITGSLIDMDKMEIFAQTVELPWLDNKQDVSCIPSGEYIVRRVVRDGYSSGFKIMNVPNRTGIFFDIANVPSELLGCIAIGRMNGEYKEQWGVQASEDAYNILLKRLVGVDKFKLLIENPC